MSASAVPPVEDNNIQKSLDEAVQGTNDDSILSKRSAVRHGYFKDPFVRYFTAKNPPRRSPMINHGYYIRMQVMETVVTTLLKRFALHQQDTTKNNNKKMTEKQEISTATTNNTNNNNSEDNKNNNNNVGGTIQMLSLGAGFDTFACRNYMTNWLPPRPTNNNNTDDDEEETEQPFYGHFFEVDFPSVMMNKVALMNQAQAMYNQQQEQQQQQKSQTKQGDAATTDGSSITTAATSTNKKRKDVPEEFILTPIPFGPNEAVVKLQPPSSQQQQKQQQQQQQQSTATNNDNNDNKKQQKSNNNKNKNNNKTTKGEKKADGSAPVPTTGGDDIPTTFYSCDRYRCIGCDLRDLNSLQVILRKNGFDFDAPTVVYAECVTQYMPREGSDALLKWVSLNLKNAIFIGYDQIRNDDAFGKQMVASLKSRLSPLLGTVSGLNTCDALLERATKTAAHFRNARCVDFQQVSNFILRDEELKRVQALEPFDEFEEWYIQCRHYALLMGLTKHADPWFEELIESEVDTNLFFWKFSDECRRLASDKHNNKKNISNNNDSIFNNPDLLNHQLGKHLPTDNPLLKIHGDHMTSASRTSTLEGSLNAVSSFTSSSSSEPKTIIVSFGGIMACAARLQPHEKVSPLYIFSVDPLSGNIQQIPVKRTSSSSSASSSSSSYPSQRSNTSLTRIHQPNSDLIEFIRNNTVFTSAEVGGVTSHGNNAINLHEDDDNEDPTSSSPIEAVFVLYGGRTSPAQPISVEDNTWLLVVHKVVAHNVAGNNQQHNHAIVSWIRISSSSSSSSDLIATHHPKPRSRHAASPLATPKKNFDSSAFVLCGGVDGNQKAFGDIWVGEVAVVVAAAADDDDQTHSTTASTSNSFRSPQRNYANQLHQQKVDSRKKVLTMCWTELKFSSATQNARLATSNPSPARSAQTMSFFSPPSTSTNKTSHQESVFPIKPCVSPQFVVLPKTTTTSTTTASSSSPSSLPEDADSETFFLFVSGGLDLVTGRIHSDNNFVGTLVAQKRIVPTSEMMRYGTSEKRIGSVDGPFRDGPASKSTFAKETLTSSTTAVQGVEGKLAFRTFSAETQQEYTSSISGKNNSNNMESLFITPRFAGICIPLEDLVASEASSTFSEKIQKQISKQSSSSPSTSSTVLQSATKHYHILLLGGIFDDNTTGNSSSDNKNTKHLHNFCEVVELVVPPTSYKGAVFPRIQRTFSLKLDGINENSDHDEFISDFANSHCIQVSPSSSSSSNTRIPPTTSLLFFGGTYNCFSFGSYSPKTRFAQLHWDGNSKRSIRDGIIYNPEFEGTSSSSSSSIIANTTTSDTAGTSSARRKKFDENFLRQQHQQELDHERRLQEIQDAEKQRKLKLQKLLSQYDDDTAEMERLKAERERQLQEQRDLAEDQLRRMREQGDADEERILKIQEDLERRRQEQERLMNEEVQVASHLKKVNEQQQQQHRDPSSTATAMTNNDDQIANDVVEMQFSEEEWQELLKQQQQQTQQNQDKNDNDDDDDDQQESTTLSASARRRLRKARELFHSDQKVTKKDDRYFVSFGRTTRPKNEDEKKVSRFGKGGSGASTPTRTRTPSSVPSSPKNAASSTSAASFERINSASPQQQQQQQQKASSSSPFVFQLPPIPQISPNHVVPNITPKILEKVVEKLRVPVLFRSSSSPSSTPLFDTSSWSNPEHIIKAEGDKTVSVHVCAGGQKSLDFVNKNFKFKHVKLSELIEHCCDEKASQEETWYLRAVGDNMRTEKTNFWQQFKNLGKELVIPEALQASEYLSEQKLQQSVFRVNQAGMKLWTHYDVLDNFLFHCAGPKRVTFFPPSMHHALYVQGSSSRVTEIDRPDLHTYPRFLEARLQAFDVFLQPGDILFIPALWFHRIEVPTDEDNNKTTSPYSVSVNLFFEKLQHNLYDAKDLYGNKDLPSMTAARTKVAKAMREGVAHVPTGEFKKFTLEQMIQDANELGESL